MRCKHCHNELPSDSQFCQYCGKTLNPSVFVKQKPAAPRGGFEPAYKTVFCRRCGKPIDDKTKICTGCGKQYFRGVSPMLFLCIVLALALIGLMAVCLVQELQYHERIRELEQLMDLYKTRIG